MDTLLLNSIKRLHDGPKGTTMRVLSGNPEQPLEFRALLGTNNPLVVETDLSRDPRALAKMDVLSTRCPDILKNADADNGIQLEDLGTGKKWQCVERDDNGADFITSFQIQQLTALDR